MQNARYKLQKRVARLASSENSEVYHYRLKQLVDFILSHEVYRFTVGLFTPEYCDAKQNADRIAAREPLVFDNELEQAATAYYLIQECAKSGKPDAETDIAFRYIRKDLTECTEFFHSYFVEALYEYIDEQLDDQGAVLYTLRKYRHRCEWFRRDELRSMWQGDTLHGEHNLARDLYEYLHDQGVELYIEPSSITGRVDFIAAQTSERRLVADVKIFDPDSGHDLSYLRKGFHQTFQYASDYGEPFAFLVIFRLCPERLSFEVASSDNGVPFLTHNHRSIFFVDVDISAVDVPASKRGTLTTYALRASDLVHELRERQEPEHPEGEASGP